MRNILLYTLLGVLPLCAAAQTGPAAGEPVEPLAGGVGAPLSSSDYRQRVLDYSLSLRQSSEQAEAVRQAMREAKTSFLPSLDFSGSGQYRVTDYEMNFGGYPMSMKPESYALDASLQQVVYAGGAVKHGYRAAQLQHRIAQKSEELTLSNVVYAAQLNYWSAAAKSALFRLTERYVRLIGEQTEVIRERYRDGLISKTDLLQIEARLYDARIQRSEAWKSYQLSLQNLNIMMGREPVAEVVLSDEIDRADAVPESVMSLDAALDRRSEFAISEFSVDYQQRQLKIQRSKFLPQFAVGVQAGWGTQMLNLDGSTMWNTYLVASLKVPLFRWGAKYKNVASQRALVRSSELDVQIVRDQVSQELYAAYTSLVEYHKQIAIAEEACATSRESLDLNTFSYNEGKLPIIDVLSSQVAWVQSNSALIQAWLQEKVAFADYNKAVGNNAY